MESGRGADSAFFPEEENLFALGFIIAIGIVGRAVVETVAVNTEAASVMRIKPAKCVLLVTENMTQNTD